MALKSLFFKILFYFFNFTQYKLSILLIFLKLSALKNIVIFFGFFLATI